MNLRQLIEGQKEQISRLGPSAPVTLYHPTDLDGATDIVTEKNRPNSYKVYPSLKHAVKHGNIVVQFYGQGKDIEAPRKRHNDPTYAEQKFPDSFNPVVSFTLLSLTPMVYYTGLLSLHNIDKIYMMQNGRPEAMTPEELLRYSIKVRGNNKRQQQRQQRLTWK
jgi:hypothetical protein